MKRLYQFMVLLCTCLISVRGFAEDAAQIDEGFPKLDKIIASDYWSGSDIEKCRALYGERPIPYLKKRFAEEAEVAAKGRVAHCLGVFRVVETTPQIVKFVKSQTQGPMTKRQQWGVYAAMFGLGSMGTEESISFLESLADGTYIETVKEKPSIPEKNYTPEETASNLQQHAIACIGYAENKVALKALDRLEEEFNGSGSASRSVDAARKWIKDHPSPKRTQ